MQNTPGNIDVSAPTPHPLQKVGTFTPQSHLVLETKTVLPTHPPPSPAYHLSSVRGRGLFVSVPVFVNTVLAPSLCLPPPPPQHTQSLSLFSHTSSTVSGENPHTFISSNSCSTQRVSRSFLTLLGTLCST